MSKSEWQIIGSRVKEARAYRGFKQQEVADYLSISRPAFSALEAGRRKLDAIELEKIAKLFKMDMRYLVCGETEELDSKTKNFLSRCTRGLSEQDKYTIFQFAEFLAQNRANNDE